MLIDNERVYQSMDGPWVANPGSEFYPSKYTQVSVTIDVALYFSSFAARM